MTVRKVAVTARALSLSWGERTILDQVSLSLEYGELLALIGPNGAGKSTLLSVLAGDIPADSGQISLAGKLLPEFSQLELARQRSVLSQDNSVSFAFPATQVIAMGRTPWARTPQRAEDNEAIARAVQSADVQHLLDRPYPQLSGGERARVSLARVLAQSTGIVFLDEPTAALDLRHQEEVMILARNLAAQGRAVVVVLHDLSLAAAFADRIALLDRGRLVGLGSAQLVLTPETISEVYGLDVDILEHNGSRVVLPRR